MATVQPSPQQLPQPERSGAHTARAWPFRAMASPCAVVLDAAQPDGLHAPAVEAAVGAAMAEVQRIEQAFSRYRSDSIVSRINAAAGTGEPVEVDAETAALLDFAAGLHALSDGLFDITSGLLRQAWDFRQARLPADGQLAPLLQRIGWPQVHWQPDQRLIHLPIAGMELDFGGFGKEYAADRAANVLLGQGFSQGYVNLGGDLRVLGPQANGRSWRLAIQDPRSADGRLASIALAEGALATSGDYERYFIQGGRRYCHILDPRTGWPVSHWRSVSVVAPVCTAAGALSTITMLKGEAGLSWLRDQGVRCLVVGPDGQLHDEAGTVVGAQGDLE